MKKEEVTHTRVKLYKSGKHWVSSVIALTLPLVLYSSQSVLAEEAGQTSSETATLNNTDPSMEPVLESDSEESSNEFSEGDGLHPDGEEGQPTTVNSSPSEATNQDDNQTEESNQNTTPSDEKQTAEEKAGDSLLNIGENKEERSLFKPQDNKIAIGKILDWTPPTGTYDEIAKSSVPLVDRVKGHQTNPLADPNVKIQSLAYLSSNAKGHSSVGGGDQGLGIYAFDYWQYLESMVYWDGLVPNPDVIDASHRNGVPIYGTIFYNWSTSEEDRNIIRYTLQEDSENSGTFPVARKLVEIAQHYGFEGYFINQETSMPGGEGYSQKFIQFLNYARNYAKSQNQRFDISWYDAMSSYGTRWHGDGVDIYNRDFMANNNQGSPSIDNFFANFNWNKSKVDTSINIMKELGRNPFDVYLGLELQKGGAYNTYVNKDALLDENGKPRLSLGLFIPDTIMGLAKDGEDFHEHEKRFWSGPTGDPTKANDAENWSGMARYTVENTPILGENFTSNFNTGHGRQWFIDGEASKTTEWNSRSVQDVMPTWRWWIQNQDSNLTAKYDFSQAYNGGTSLQLNGSLKQNGKSKVMLYASQLDVKDDTILKVVAKANKNQKAKIGLATSKDYAEESTVYLEIDASSDWQVNSQSLAQLAGKTIYGISLLLEGDQDTSDLQFNLGQISIARQAEKLASPTNLKVEKSLIHTSQKAEAIVSYDKVEGASYYEIYQEIDGQWHIVNATSSNYAYLPTLMRSRTDQGTTQNLKVLAVGKDGKRSEVGMGQFDWNLEVDDTTPAKEKAKNIVPGSTITSSNAAGNSESAENILTGTINNTSDKWYSGKGQDHVDIRLDKPRNVVRWVVDHAGAGGEAVEDGSMNTKAFDLQYKDMETGQWKVAYAITNNKKHVTDVVLDTPILAQEWRLNVTDPDNGTPWGGIRIYNWKMYEEVDTETDNIPMNKASLSHISGQSYLAKFKDVPKDSTITLYADKAATQAIGSGSVSETGDLLISNINLSQPKGTIYYRTRAIDKEESNILALTYEQTPRIVESVQLVRGDKFQSEYSKNEALSLEDAALSVTSRNGETVTTEIIPLSHDLVQVGNLDSSRLGEHHLPIYFNGEEISDRLDVTVIDKDIQDDMAQPIGITLKNKGKTNYQKGSDLDLTDATFEILYENGKREVIPFSDKFSVEGYDPFKEGQQVLRIQYENLDLTTNISVEALNHQVLDQSTSQLVALTKDKRFAWLSGSDQQAYLDIIQQVDTFKMDAKILQGDVNKKAAEVSQHVNQLRLMLEQAQKPEISKQHDKLDGTTQPLLPEFPLDNLKKTEKLEDLVKPALPEFPLENLRPSRPETPEEKPETKEEMPQTNPEDKAEEAPNNKPEIKPETKPEEKANDATKSQETKSTSTLPASSSLGLPNTGENLNHIFYPATLSILAGLGLVATSKKREEY